MFRSLLSVLVLTLAITAFAEPPVIDNATARLELARTLRDDGQLAEAATEYRRLLAADPKQTGAALELAEILIWQKQLDEAARLLAAIPDDQLGADGHRAVAELAVQQNDFAKAAEHFAKAVALKPDDDRTRFAYAQALTWLKKYDAALEQFAILLEHRPDDVQLRRHYAQVLGWAGKRQAAIEQWRKSLSAPGQ